MKRLTLIALLAALALQAVAAEKTYRNPIIHADYSDPDACRVGADY
jgi:beta-xylosidase